MESIFLPEVSDSDDVEIAGGDGTPPGPTVAAERRLRQGTASSQTSANPRIDDLSAALRQAQLSASDAHRQAQMDVYNGSSASARSRVVERPLTDEVNKALYLAGQQIFVMCTPWPSWMISGDRIAGDPKTPAAGKINETDDAGREILSYVPPQLIPDFLSAAGQKIVTKAMAASRSWHISRLRGSGSLIFGPGFEQNWFPSKVDRGSNKTLQDLLGAQAPPIGKKYALLPPVLFPSGSSNKRDIFLNPALIKVLKVILFGPSSLEDKGNHSGPKPAGVKWRLTEVTPGAIALAAILVRFLISPDEDFSRSGAKSGINYVESFKKYKQMLSDNPGSSMYMRIFSEFNNSLFGTAPILGDRHVADDGNYDSELEEFNNGLDEGSAEDGEVSFPPSLPVPPQPDHHISISVTSNVLHTTAASESQVSSVISSFIALPPENEVVNEDTPPPQKAIRPLPKKKGGRKPKTKAPNTDADAATALNDQVIQRPKATPIAGLATRVLRTRG